MNHSNFNFYDAFDFDDDTPVFVFKLLLLWLLKKNRIIKGGEHGIVALFLTTILSIVIERKVS